MPLKHKQSKDQKNSKAKKNYSPVANSKSRSGGQLDQAWG